MKQGMTGVFLFPFSANTMHITRDTAVTLSYTLSDPTTGQTRDTGTTAYLHGGYDNLFAKVEQALEGLAVGEKITVDLSVDEAFGARDEKLAIVIAKSEFPPGIKVGGQMRGAGPNGPMLYNVLKVKGPHVYLDGNHPLAGLALRMSATVRSVRPATAEEIAHRHVHGEHGHQH